MARHARGDWAPEVRRRLKELGKTQQELARAIDAPLSRVQLHLSGKGRPSVGEGLAVASVLARWSN